MGLVDDLGGYGAEKRLFDRAVTTRAKDDEVRPDLFGHFDDDRCRASLDQPGRDLEAGPSQACDRPLEQGFAVDPQAVLEVIARNVGNADVPRAAIPLGLGRENRQDLEPRARRPRQAGRCLEGKGRFGRAVDREQCLHQRLLCSDGGSRVRLWQVPLAG